MDWKDYAPIKRRAVIIGGHDERQNKPSNGVLYDIAAWRNYLMSPLGGNWNRLEIHEVTSGKPEDLALAFNWANNSDYSFLCFSGHGYLEADENGRILTKLMIHDNFVISEQDLNVGTKWSLAIIDCCRKFPPPPMVPTEDALIKEAVEVKRFHNTRSAYDSALRRSEYGFVKVYSAGLNEAAGDEISFTRELLKAADKNISCCQDGILNIRDAVNLVGSVRYGSNLDEQQHPIYCGGRRLGHFPFAVRPVPLID